MGHGVRRLRACPKRGTGTLHLASESGNRHDIREPVPVFGQTLSGSPRRGRGEAVAGREIAAVAVDVGDGDHGACALELRQDGAACVAPERPGPQLVDGRCAVGANNPLAQAQQAATIRPPRDEPRLVGQPSALESAARLRAIGVDAAPGSAPVRAWDTGFLAFRADVSGGHRQGHATDGAGLARALPRVVGRGVVTHGACGLGGRSTEGGQVGWCRFGRLGGRINCCAE